MEKKMEEQGEEKNQMMKAINSMKEALSQIEKEYTMQQGTGLGEQDGNMGQAEDGEQDYSKMDKALLTKAMKKAMME